jgi:dienelactone hydrolase
VKGFAILALVFWAASACHAQSTSGARLPLEIFRYDRSAPLELTTQLVSDESGVATYSISYASPRGGRATGFLYVPAAPGLHPGIIVQHGMPSRARDMSAQSQEFARRGAVVIAIDAPWARRGQVLFWDSRDSANQVQLIVDLQRAVDVLLQRKDVDPRRLAYVGISYGGAMGALFAGIERRLATYVLRVGDGGLVSHFTGAEDPPNPPGVSVEAWERWLAAMKPIEPLRFIANAAPTPIYFQSGELDRLVPPADARALHAAAREPMKVSWYPAGHGLNPQANLDMIQWLAERVGLK